MTLSVPPYSLGGIASVSGAIWAIRMNLLLVQGPDPSTLSAQPCYGLRSSTETPARPVALDRFLTLHAELGAFLHGRFVPLRGSSASISCPLRDQAPDGTCRHCRR